MHRRTLLAGAVLALAASAGAGVLTARAVGKKTAAAEPRAEQYAYRDAAFTRFVDDSYRTLGSGQAEDFYTWFERQYAASPVRYPGREDLSLPDLLDAKREELSSISDPAGRARAQMELGGWIHKMVKKVIPRFSLDRGYDFYNTVRYGERQCFLQAVLIAGLLQRAGVNAGVAMVSRNIEGVETNNGHAVTVVKLADGTDVLVDASDPIPHVRQQGLYMRAPGYRYLTPVYRPDSVITSYVAVGSGEKLAPSRVRTLDIPFLRSQFAFYRGERAPGGIVSGRPTAEGLEASARYLRESVALCPDNPLATYTLGRVYLKQGKRNEARAQILAACDSYTKAGWLPRGPRDFRAMLSPRAAGG